MRLGLRAKVLTYVVLLHVVLAALVAVILAKEPAWLFPLEGLFLLSAILGVLLVRAFFVPLRMIETGAELMRDQEFNVRFRKVGQSELDGLIEIYNDMAARLREQQIEAEEKSRFITRVFEHSPSAVVILDHDGRVAELNASAERLLDKSASELVGQRPEDRAHPLLAELARQPIDEPRVRAHGERRLRGIHARFLDRGAPRSVILVDELTGELREIEKQAFSKVIRMMSHEVHNSVGAVRSLLETCEDYAAQLADADRTDYSRALAVSIGRLDALAAFMERLASVVRVPAPEKRPTDLAPMMRDLGVLLAPELRERRITLQHDLADTLTAVLVDKNQLEQVLVNALRNAIEAIGEDGTITLASGRLAGKRWLAVRDTGPGLPPALLERLHTPFFTTKKDGRGVGLTLSREIIAQHGFTMALENRQEGGAELRIELDS